ncbi:MAG: Txe/YoeB family addiction module toxin [Bacteroidales bacterium]|nr:Txe/YoeB family addiction module toxin [Lentimicrobiaceae bacterium]MBQ2852314.1 Txe/YoeB family addiction module toxin [Bacteroidales bacterium]
MYRIVFTEEAQKDLQLLHKKAPQAIKKLKSLLVELQQHPRTGTGQIEQLKYYTEETWSRRINKEHRLVYRIYDDVVEVLVLSTYGHYL